MSISARMYNFIIGLVLLYGFAANWYLVTSIPTQTLAAIPQWEFLVGYIVSCFFGIYLYKSSDNPAISFIGYNFIVVPFGLVLNLFLSRYTHHSIVSAIEITGFATAGMMFLGMLYPDFFKGIASGLFWGLVIAIVVELVMGIFMHTHLPIMDWIVAAIFCGYIGYDWALALEKPKTVDNAIDSAADLYIDIVNLFVRILAISGND